jgi:RNA polymerase sigma-70 factor (ECF subfamily)
VEVRPLDEDILIARARRGEAQAYGLLVTRYQDIAVRVAYLTTHDPDEAHDAAQEAFIKAYYALPRFRVGAPFRAWLLRIVSNEARNRVKAAHRRRKLVLQLAEHQFHGDADASPQTAAVGAFERQRLLAAVNALSESDQLVVAQRYFLELSEAEMAEILGCPRGTVKSRLSRALARLRHSLETQESERD